MRRRLIGVAAGATLAVVLAVAPASAQYANITLLVNGSPTNTFTAGQSAQLNATGLLPNTTYDLFFSQSPQVNLGNGTTNAAGNVIINFTIPADARVGNALLTLDARGANDTHRIPINIRAAAPATGVQIPKTGTDVDLFLGGGVVLLLAGITMLLYTRRHRALGRMGGDGGSGDRERVTLGPRS